MKWSLQRTKGSQRRSHLPYNVKPGRAEYLDTLRKLTQDMTEIRHYYDEKELSKTIKHMQEQSKQLHEESNYTFAEYFLTLVRKQTRSRSSSTKKTTESSSTGTSCRVCNPMRLL